MFIECGGTFTALSGFIASPNYPKNYENNLLCDYKIRLPEGKTIALSFLKFDLEPDNACRYDSVKIYEVNENGAKELQNTHCGLADIPDYVSKGNALDIVFKTDGSTSKEGFSIRYIDSENSGKTTPKTGICDFFIKFKNILNGPCIYIL